MMVYGDKKETSATTFHSFWKTSNFGKKTQHRLSFHGTLVSHYHSTMGVYRCQCPVVQATWLKRMMTQHMVATKAVYSIDSQLIQLYANATSESAKWVDFET